jgi:hypothetical protein
MDAAAATRVGAGMLGEIEEASLDEVRCPVTRCFWLRGGIYIPRDVDG